MKYLTLLLLLSVTYSQDIERTSEFKRSTAYGQDCDDTEYRDYKGSPAWKGYGGWLSECDSIRSVNLDKEFTERSKKRAQEKAVQDSIDMASIDEMDLDLNTSFNFLLVALWGERKNIPNTIRWFIETFIDNPDVGLIVKTAIRSGCTVDRITMEETLTQFLQRWPDRKCKVYLLHGRLTNGEKNYLYNNEKVHALVSITHGEGFGLPMLEAAACGLPVIATNWSGHLDFLDPA